MVTVKGGQGAIVRYRGISTNHLVSLIKANFCKNPLIDGTRMPEDDKYMINSTDTSYDKSMLFN